MICDFRQGQFKKSPNRNEREIDGEQFREQIKLQIRKRAGLRIKETVGVLP